MISVLWADVSGLSAEKTEIPLTAYREEKLRHIKPPLSRQQSLCAELLLYESLKRIDPAFVWPPKILCTKDGKPYLEEASVFFSLSHSGSYAACAVSDSPVGLDLQVPQPYKKEIAERFFGHKERSYILSSLDLGEAFTELWCRKESFLKATGHGLKLLQSVQAVPGESFNREGRRYSCRYQRLPCFHLAVCVQGELPECFLIEETPIIGIKNGL